jgi:hypothetical protein
MWIAPARGHWPRLLLALLIVLGGLGRGMGPAGSSIGPDAATRALVQAMGGTLCHPDADQPADPAAPRAPDCAMCPFCATPAAQAAMQAAAPDLPKPPVLPQSRFARAAHPRAPPPATPRLAQPRGPPFLA